MNNTVLVTGADGFIGSHLTECLLKKGFKVRALAQYNSFNSWGWLEDLPASSNLEVICGDVRDAGFCLELVAGTDVVYHLAALIAIPYSYHAPRSYIDTNVSGTLNICEAAKYHGVKRVIHTSTSEVYGTAQFVPITESHPLQPQSPYSASKISADALAMSYFNSFELPVTIARPFNTFGPRQSARAVIPSIISQIASGAREIAVGDLTPTRDFNFVLDTCAGFMAMAATEATIGETVNIASNFEVSIADTFELIRELMEANVQFVQDPKRMRPTSSEVYRLYGSADKLHDLTGYKPDTEFKQGLKTTIDWFTRAENIKKYKSHLYNL